jgi:putative transposase
MRRAKQQELNLYLGKRGGARPGAGRPRSPNRRIPHTGRDPFRKTQPCHVTLRVRRGLQSLRLGHVLRAIEETFRRGRAREDFRLVHYSIQGNHAHLVVEADGPEALGRGMKSIASRFALAVNRSLKRHGPVLYDRYHFRVMKTPTDVRNVLRYVLLNGRKHWMESLRRRGKDVSASARAKMRALLDPPPPRAGSTAGATGGSSTGRRRRGLAPCRRWRSPRPGCSSTDGGCSGCSIPATRRAPGPSSGRDPADRPSGRAPPRHLAEP